MNLQPSGQYLMEDFYYAGGLPAVLREIQQVLNKDAITANGKTLGENIASAPVWNREVIKSFDDPFKANAGIAILRGNLAPDGAVIKPSAATPKLLKHRGRAVVFETIEEFKAKIDDPEPGHRRELHHGAQGLRAEGLPGHGRGRQHGLAAEGLEERHHRHGAHLRCAQSGTAYGTVVLHVRAGSRRGRSAGVGEDRRHDRSGRCAGRKLHLEASDAELAKRRAA